MLVLEVIHRLNSRPLLVIPVPKLEQRHAKSQVCLIQNWDVIQMTSVLALTLAKKRLRCAIDMASLVDDVFFNP